MAAKRPRGDDVKPDPEPATAPAVSAAAVEPAALKRVKAELPAAGAPVKADSDAGEDDSGFAFASGRTTDRRGQKCPYLDTINRPLLDFDFEKLCSVSLSNHNVYGCLVCGKFFQGRGQHTHAYTHSVQAGHHVFINLDSGKVYCLPGVLKSPCNGLATRADA